MPNATDDVTVVKSYYERFNSGDWDGMCALLADDVQHDLNQGPREIGRAKFRVFLDRMARSYQEQLHDVVVMGDGAGRVAAEYVVVGAYLADDPGLPPASGQRYRLPGGAFFSVEAGRITRVTNYYNLEDWLAQIRAWPTP
ncbi:MAG: nuclear transport factor 2 family protein [Deltaproteobacteria bacterium]|nr:nuclear transport factor 2 family protein [Kofleriaceae bacterium]